MTNQRDRRAERLDVKIQYTRAGKWACKIIFYSLVFAVFPYLIFKGVHFMITLFVVLAILAMYFESVDLRKKIKAMERELSEICKNNREKAMSST